MRHTLLFGISNRLVLLGAFVVVFFLFGRIALTHAASVSHPIMSNTGNRTPTACGSWSVVSSPNANTQSNYLRSVAAISPNDVWAVGGYYPGRTLLEHWNGSSWTLAKKPGAGGRSNTLSAVAAVASNDVWAVGGASLSGQPSQTWIEHWNGVKWVVVPSPNNPAGGNTLSGITALSANDIWAAGYYYDATGADYTLIEHWDGTQWSIVASPSVNAGMYLNFLYSVTAISSNDVWAVGDYYVSGVSTSGQTLVEHWDGTQWSIVSSPNQGVLGSGLVSVSADASNDVWAVGSYEVSGNPYGYEQTLVEHWNGTQWSVVSSPNLGNNWNSFSAVIAIAPKNVWAAGTYIHGSKSTSPYNALIQHWDGTQWSVVTSPNAGTAYNYLVGITQVPGSGQLWAVGQYANKGAKQPLHTLTEFYC